MREIVKDIQAWILSFFIALFIVFLLKTFIGMPTKIKGDSMYPTLVSKERIILSTWKATFNKVPDRGDCITFEAPSLNSKHYGDTINPIAFYDENNKNFMDKVLYDVLGITSSSYIKRVIGLPGEHVEIKDGKVYINGTELEEDYLQDGVVTDILHGGRYTDVLVPDGCVYVLGDNRSASSDSRTFGCIPINKIEGKAWIRWWPFEKFGIL